VEETKSADEDEGDYPIVALSSALEFAKRFQTFDECTKPVFLMKPSVLKEVAAGLKSIGSLTGCLSVAP
jgi:hypothetical protein